MVTIKEIVDDYLLEEGRDYNHQYRYYSQLAIGGYRDLHNDLTGAVELICANVNKDNLTIPIPPSCIQVLSVGHIVNGMYVAFDNNKNAMGGRQTLPLVANIDGGVASFGANPRHFVNGENIGANYGLGGYTNMISNVNMREGYITLNSYFPTKNVYMECLMDIKTVNAEYIIHDFLREPIKNWIDWTSKKRKTTVSGAEKRRLELQYYDSKSWAGMQLASLNAAKIKNAQRRNFKLTPKV